MAEVAVINQNGEKIGVQKLPLVFESPVVMGVMHQALVRQLANARRGTHSTKTRGEVRGGGRKPYRQKGTGRARQGTIRAPQYAGGGIVFGPKPRSYVKDMPRKQRRLALRSALTVKANDGAITVLEGFNLDIPKTKAVVACLNTVGVGKRALIVLSAHNEILERSARNLAHVQVISASNLSVRDLLMAESILITTDALNHIAEALS